jgi:hypothetical protein
MGQPREAPFAFRHACSHRIVVIMSLACMWVCPALFFD